VIQKSFFPGFLQQLSIIIQNFTFLLYVCIYAKLQNFIKLSLTMPPGMQPSHQVCKAAYLVPVPSQDKLGGFCQERHPA